MPPTGAAKSGYERRSSVRVPLCISRDPVSALSVDRSVSKSWSCRSDLRWLEYPPRQRLLRMNPRKGFPRATEVYVSSSCGIRQGRQLVHKGRELSKPQTGQPFVVLHTDLVLDAKSCRERRSFGMLSAPSEARFARSVVGVAVDID